MGIKMEILSVIQVNSGLTNTKMQMKSISWIFLLLLILLPESAVGYLNVLISHNEVQKLMGE